MEPNTYTSTKRKKPLILRLVVERDIDPCEQKFVYDPLTSVCKYNGGKIDYTSVMELMTKTEQGREEDRSDCEVVALDCMTKTFSSKESDD